ncbi:MAG: BrnT family toxin [Burkholderiales bacterium]|nr:BrnT family toxin [Burkholderiales bacterium]
MSDINAPVELNFEWDASKAEINLRKHDVTFARATQVFSDPLALTVYDEAHSQYEERWHTMGYDTRGSILLVTHTYQSTSLHTARIRLISARLANKQERRFYADEPR